MKPPQTPPSTRAVEDLSQQATNATLQQPNLLTDVTAAIKTAMASEVDPYLLAGVLLEGVVQTLTRRIPSHRRSDTAMAAQSMLRARIEAVVGALDQARGPCDPCGSSQA